MYQLENFWTSISGPRNTFLTQMEDAFAHFRPVFLLGKEGAGKEFLIEHLGKSKEVAAFQCGFYQSQLEAEMDLMGAIIMKRKLDGGDHEVLLGKIGLIEKAKDNFLHIQNIEDCQPAVQLVLCQLIKSFKGGHFSFNRVGDAKSINIKTQLIVSSDLHRDSLRKKLHKNLWDIISPYILEFPDLRSSRSDRCEDWKWMWNYYWPKESPPEDEEFFIWLTKISLPRNFIDLKKIANYYREYDAGSPEYKQLATNAFEYARQLYVRFQGPMPEPGRLNFSQDRSIKEMESEYKQKLAIWAIEHFGSAQKAADHFQKRGDKISLRTFYAWKNRK